MNEVRYLTPTMVRRQIQWVHQCEAIVETPESQQYRTQHKAGMQCVRRAKVDFRGKKMCFMHAQIHALRELAGPDPTFALSAESKQS